ncbi:MAG TPA: hypothetical protein VJ907_01000 [Halanaerobiales bacterium]|nr:hypothetical protein [Halanaerobiales bacterium]
MRKLLGIGTALMVLMVLVAVPAVAQEAFNNEEMPGYYYGEDVIFDDAETEEIYIGEEIYYRDDLITNNAFRDALGITTVQQAAGNASVLESNVTIEGLEEADEFELSAQEVEVEEVLIMERDYTRVDTISGNAFRNATGITTVQQAAGNANVVQSNVEVNIGAAFAAPEL